MRISFAETCSPGDRLSICRGCNMSLWCLHSQLLHGSGRCTKEGC